MNQFFGFFLSVVALVSQWVFVITSPLGVEVRGVGIHQRQPNYLPAYNGIFSIHALNFSSTADTPLMKHQVLANISVTSDDGGLLDTTDSLGEHPLPEDGTDINELDFSRDRIKVTEEPITFPQLHVVSQTIQDVPSSETSVDGDKIASTFSEEEETRTKNAPLLEDPEDNSIEDDVITEGTSEDIFDRLMATIQDHWLEFVGKMKMSVLDVWKSISQHMMERLENFASAL